MYDKMYLVLCIPYIFSCFMDEIQHLTNYANNSQVKCTKYTGDSKFFKNMSSFIKFQR